MFVLVRTAPQDCWSINIHIAADVAPDVYFGLKLDLALNALRPAPKISLRDRVTDKPGAPRLNI
jgi:hypothetical protein